VVGNANAGSWAFYPLQKLKEAGHDVRLICPSDGPLPQRARSAGIAVSILPFPQHMRRLDQAAKYIALLSDELRRQRVDVVHNHLVSANIWGRIAAWVARVPVRVTQWPGPLPLEIPTSRRIELALAWMDSALIAASTATQRIYQRYPHTRNKIKLIYYGFPFERFDPAIDGGPTRRALGIAPDAPVVSLIAYMYSPLAERQLPGLKMFNGLGLKGHETLISAAMIVRERIPQAKFLIVGDALMDGEAERYKQRLYQMVSELGLTDTVIFTGKRDDIPELLAASDIVAVPSLSENVGGAVEPLLMQRPVVASRVGGLPDVVIDGETGFLVPPGDAQALANALLQALALPRERRDEMGRRGRSIVIDLFDLGKTVARTETLYYQLLNHSE
jgi:glycosyltransferase involved in cell wall biosynthesis